MCYEKTKDVNFGGVTLKKLLSCRLLKTTQNVVESFCSGIKSMESVYFIELTKEIKEVKVVVDKKPKSKRLPYAKRKSGS